MKNLRIDVTNDLRIVGLRLAPIEPEAAINLATALLRKAARRIIVDEAQHAVLAKPSTKRAK
jgi:hypothetical protein